MKKPFLAMTRNEQADIVRALMDNHSFGSAAKKLGVRRGRIAGICRDYDIRSKQSAGFKELPKGSSGVVLKLAPPGKTQCEAMVNGHQCAYLKEPGSSYCALPAHHAQEKKRRRS